MPAYFNVKLITSEQSHLWNDALHARALARQTLDDWYRGTYVRWTVTTAWTVLEICCRDALGNNRIGNRFKDDVNAAIAQNGFSPIAWGGGVWQTVLELQPLRTKYTHMLVQQDELWPDTEVADRAIVVVRNAVKDIYRIANKQIPEWVDMDEDDGWRTV